VFFLLHRTLIGTNLTQVVGHAFNGLFSGLVSLKTLNLDNNPLQLIDSFSFKDLSQLTTL
jgi:hypothetical protein